MADLELALKLKATDDGFTGTVRRARDEHGRFIKGNDDMDRSARRAGQGLEAGGRGAGIFRRQASELNSTSNALSGSLNMVAKAAGFAAGLLGGITLGALLADMTRTIYQAEQLRGSLLSAVGGVPEMADRAFAALEGFASRTPFALDQSVQAFIKLQNLGIRPTEERLMGFGNVAAAMGKDLNQMIEAVADASTGEFERLKEFGIKASSEGDRVKFTFQGVSTTVAKESEAITQYLTDIGNNKFGDAMANQMNRLPGLWSNLKDNIDGIWRDIGDAGITSMLSGWLQAGIGWTDSMRRAIKAGWFDWIDAELDVYAARFGGWWEVLSSMGKAALADIRATLSSGETEAYFEGLGNIIGFVSDAVADLPINLRTLGAIAIAETDKLAARGIELAQLLAIDAQMAWESASYAAESALQGIELAAAEAVEASIQHFGSLVSQVGATLAAINSTGLGDALVSDSALASIQQTGAAMQQYQGISQGVREEIAATNAEHARAVSALEAERVGIETQAAARVDAANEFVTAALAERDASLAARDAKVQEAEAAAAAAQSSYEHNAALKQEAISIDDVTSATQTKSGATQAEVASLDKLLDRLDPARAASRQYKADVEDLTARLADGTISQDQFNGAIAALDAAAAKGGSALDKLLGRLDPTRAATRQFKADVALLEAGLTSGAITQAEYNAAVGALEKEANKSASALDKLLDRLNPARAATRQYTEDMALLEAGLAAGKITQEEFNASVAALEIEATKAIGGVLSVYEALQTAWKRGIERMDDLAQGWLKNFFLTGKISITGVKDLFLEMLAEMVYAAARNKIVLTFATAGGGGLVSAGAAAATGGDGGALSLLSGAKTMYDAVTGSVTSGINSMLSTAGDIYTNVGNFLLSAGEPGSFISNAGVRALETGRTYSYGSTTSGVVNAGVNLVAGFAGNYLGRQVFGGETTGIGSAAGGIVGSIVGGPIGTAIGAFLGEGLETAFNKAFGIKEGGNNAARATLDASTGALSVTEAGKNTAPENLAAAQAIGEEINNFAALIGGSSFKGVIDVGSKDGIKFQGTKYKDENQFLGVVYRQVIEQATNLDETLRDMLLGLSGNAQSLRRDVADALSLRSIMAEGDTFFDGMTDFAQTFQILTTDFRREGESLNTTILRLEGGLALLDAAGQDATRSVDNFVRAQELIDQVGLETANNILYAMNVMGDGVRRQAQSLRDASARSNMDIYETLIAQNRELIASYDGSIAASAALAQATEVRRQSELALLAEIEAVTASVTGRIASFREQLILDGLDEEGQYNRARDQISDLAAQISTAGSASQVDRLMSQIDSLGKTAYGLLDEGQQDNARSEFLDWLDTIEALATDRLGALEDDVITTSEAVDAETQSAIWTRAGLAGENLEAAATALQDAGGAHQDAAVALTDAADRLTAATADLEAAARVVRDMLPQPAGVLN